MSSKFWSCDNCGWPIMSSDSGRVEWIGALNGDGGRALRLVHGPERGSTLDCRYRESRCNPNERVCAAPLTDYVGAEGIERLTAMLDCGFVRKEVTHLMKRLFADGFEWSECVVTPVARHP